MEQDILPIGGYFELELRKQFEYPQQHGIRVNSGRHALEYILRAIGQNKIMTIYVPIFTCDSVYHHLRKLGVHYEFYHINEQLEIATPPVLKDDEYIIVNNYFGIKGKYVNKLSLKYKTQLIIDNSQAYFEPTHIGERAFYSPRKFVGVPDGGMAFTSGEYKITDTDVSYDRCSHLLKRIDAGASAGYGDFHRNSETLTNAPLMKMSHLTETLLLSIDYDDVMMKRKANYDILREALEGSNLLKTPSSKDVACPMVYPYMTEDTALRSHLINNKIFVATYWPNVLRECATGGTEYRLANEILPLPIDQRYGEKEMKFIIKTINEYGK